MRQNFLSRYDGMKVSGELPERKRELIGLRTVLLVFRIMAILPLYCHQKSNPLKITTQFESWVILLNQLHKTLRFTYYCPLSLAAAWLCIWWCITSTSDSTEWMFKSCQKNGRNLQVFYLSNNKNQKTYIWYTILLFYHL